MTEDEKQQIRLLFALVLRLIKTESESNMKTIIELASLTAAVRALDPTFDEIVERHRQDVEETANPVLCADVAQFDDAIRKVESGEWI